MSAPSWFPSCSNSATRCESSTCSSTGNPRSNRFAATPGWKSVKGDVRDQQAVQSALRGCDAVIHLACISNDPSVELDPQLSHSINYESFGPLVRLSKGAGVRRFIFASSGSVYGISDSPDVTEEHALVPVSLYNKYKALCEPVLLEQQSAGFVPVVVRPATICGYSPRQRLDLTVNILTNHAVNADRITVFGGTQMRPNLHIQDMVDLYALLLEVPDAVDCRQDLQRRLPELLGRRDGSTHPRRRLAGLARKRRGSRRNDAVGRSPVVSPFVAENSKGAGLCSQAHHRRCGSRLGPCLPGRQTSQLPDRCAIFQHSDDEERSLDVTRNTRPPIRRQADAGKTIGHGNRPVLCHRQQFLLRSQLRRRPTGMRRRRSSASAERPKPTRFFCPISGLNTSGSRSIS